MALQVRWLGRAKYKDAYALQKALFGTSTSDYLLLCEHNHVFTLGVRADKAHILVEPAAVDAEVFDVDRGGDVTYHGPGQLVGYPIINVDFGSDMTPRYVHSLEEAIIRTLSDYGIDAAVLEGYPGVWVGANSDNPRKIAAIGVKITRGRTMHGFALNVSTNMDYFSYIVPCGLTGMAVTSMAQEGVDVPLAEVGEKFLGHFARIFGFDDVNYAGVDRSAPWAIRVEKDDNEHRAVASRLNQRLKRAGVDPASGLVISERKPPWLRLRAEMGPEYRQLKSFLRKMSLTTVCEEAGCPNIYECWQQGTATFMINGDKCTRSCGFCLVDTSKPLELDPEEPGRVATAVSDMGLSFAVVTAVARDDLADGGAGAFRATIDAIHDLDSGCGVEVLIPDCKGDETSLATIFDARPEVLNHNIETPLRLQRAVRPQASYARSLSVLARAKEAGLVVKSGIMVGIGETIDEVKTSLFDLRSVGVDIVTIGQYLRPTEDHLPIARYYTPEEFDELRAYGYALGFAHVEASPMARSSYHAKTGASAVRSQVLV